jgi:hypothetical protein
MVRNVVPNAMLRRLMRPLWIILAAVFLFEAWLWDKLTAFSHWLRGWLPFEAFKAWVGGVVSRMPPWGALLLFVIPVAIVQPLKFGAFWLMLHGHFFLGVIGFIAVKIVGFGAVAFLFELTRDKLMQFRWFVWIYEHILLLKANASTFISPYKAALREQMAAVKAATFRMLGLKGDRRTMLARLRARMRR